jgi:hypothetical protein
LVLTLGLADDIMEYTVSVIGSILYMWCYPFMIYITIVQEHLFHNFLLNKSELCRKSEVILYEGCYYRSGWCICKKWENSNNLGMTVTDQDSIHREIKSRLNSDNAYFSSFQNLFTSCLLSRNLKRKIYNTTVLHVVLYEW